MTVAHIYVYLFIRLLQYIAEVKAASELPPIDGQFILSPTKYIFENSENLTSGLDSIPNPFLDKNQ